MRDKYETVKESNMIQLDYTTLGGQDKYDKIHRENDTRVPI